MKRTCIVGIDNGVTGSIMVLYDDKTFTFLKTPVIKQRNYTKKAKTITRVDFEKLYTFFQNLKTFNDVVMAVLERPMVNPKRFDSTISAIRCLESTQIILESNRIPFVFIDSKAWQSEFLPDVKGSDKLKEASDKRARKKFPSVAFKDGEGDSANIADYAMKHFVEIKEIKNGNRRNDEENSGPAEAA